MRIIGGRIKGIHILPPKNLPVRPTTDMAKEALFNFLNNRYDLPECKVLDLFAGTGNISLEFASRGAEMVLAVDADFGCIKWIKQIAQQHELLQIDTRKADVFKYLTQESASFDLIFADPPYHLAQIPQIPDLVFTHKRLNAQGMLIIEHPSMMRMPQQDGYLETRKYGNSSFSFYQHP